MDEDLTTHEEFIGLYDMDSTTAENITRVIQDILLRLSLQMSIAAVASVMMVLVLWLAVEQV